MLPSKYNGRPRGFAVSRSVAVRLAAFLVFATGFFSARPCGAQWALGAWDDATTVPRGVLRAGIFPSWQRANERYGRSGGQLEPLGAAFTRDSLGSSIFPQLATLSAPLAALTGLPSPALSLGRLRVAMEATEVVTPIAVDYGLTSRLSLGLVVPYVKTRAEVFAHPNPTGTEGTLGLNPALAAPGARARNGLVVGELQTAANTLQAELTRCLTSSDASCTAINSDRAAAIGLVSSANAVAGAVATVYGTASANGSLFAPVDRASLQKAVEARLAAFNAQFKSLLGMPPSGDWVASRPVGAPPLALADFQRVLTDSAFGIVAAPFTDIERSHLGDVELGAKMVVFGRNAQYAAGSHGPGAGVRLALAGLVRLGTGQKDSPDQFADIGTGDGQTDIEARAFLDVLGSRRWWASIVARYGVQLADRIAVRVPSASDDPFPAAGRTVDLNRDLGDYLEIEVAPRFTPTEAFSFSGNYRVRSKGADRYAFSGATLPSEGGSVAQADIALLDRFSAQREQRVGLAMTYSTLRGYAERRAPWPLDVSLVHTQVIEGKGRVGKQFATGFAVRWYHQFSGRDAMREPRR